MAGPKMITDANRRLAWVPTLADYNAPTLTEITAGLDISCLVTAANFALGATGDATITDPALCASSESSVPGRTTYTAAMDFFRWQEELDDEAWTTFTAKNISGYLVQRIGQKPEGVKGHEHPWTALDEVQVYSVITATPQILSPADAGFEKFRMMFMPQDEIDERAVIATTGGTV